MSLQFLMRSAHRATPLLLPKISAANCGFHSMSKSVVLNNGLMKSIGDNFLIGFLRPINPIINVICGLKYKVRLKLHCKDCYFYWVEGVLHVRCPTHGNHRQAQKKPKLKNTLLLTSASQSKWRAW